jgi:fermentation-respiration switch protein FrsA (DUF1100 family)
MLVALHYLIAALYQGLPPLALAAAGTRARQIRSGAPLTGFAFTAAVGLTIGLSLNLVYATVSGGRMIAWQIVLAAYFATGMLLLLKVFDRLLQAGLDWLFRLKRQALPALSEEGAETPAPAPAAVPAARIRGFLAGVVRIVVLFGVGLPYVMAAVLTYRPKVAPVNDPQEQLGFAYEPVRFAASDGVPLAGWWIPALPPRTAGQAGDAAWGTRTVLVCHGLASSKSNQLIMAAPYPPAGFNVLIFDFRAHGESGGQLATFGDRERHDVLGAVRWLREQRGDHAVKICGVGASQGAAALIAAAADDSEHGRAIDALAVYATYDNVPALTRTIANRYFFPPLRQLLVHIGLPLASAQTGANLATFAPARLLADVWPRPVLVIHGRRDEIISFEHGESLYDHAYHPKYSLWLDGDHNEIVNSDTAARIVVEFFKVAEPVPVI